MSSILIVVLLTAFVSGCAPMGTHAATSAIGTVVARPPQRILVPPCGPNLGAPVLSLDHGIPHDIYNIVGFRPVLPASIPAPLTWNLAVIAGRAWTQGPTPLFHAAYGVWAEQPKNTYALHTTVALDETTTTLSPTTNIVTAGETLSIASQTPVSVNGTPAILYALQTSVSAATGETPTRITALQWHEADITLRLTAVESGAYELFPSGNNAFSDQLTAWTWSGGSDSQLLQQLAQQVNRYSGCGPI